MSTEALPRTIAPSEVRADDEVEIVRTSPTLTRSVRATVREVGPTGFVIGDGAESEAFSFPHWRGDETIDLLSRPTPRGPAHQAGSGSHWVDTAGNKWVYTAVAPGWFIDVETGVYMGKDVTKFVDRLVSVPPPSELETPRQNVIDTAEALLAAMYLSGTDAQNLRRALGALRDAEDRS